MRSLFSARPSSSAHPRESGDPGFFRLGGSDTCAIILKTGLIQNLGPRFRGDERGKNGPSSVPALMATPPVPI
jgi:hypothetical protein